MFDITDLIVWLFSSNRPAYTGEVVILLAVVALLTLGRATLVFMRPRESTSETFFVVTLLIVVTALFVLHLLFFYTHGSHMPDSHRHAEVALFTQVSISNTLRRILAVPKSVVFCNFSIAISIFSCSILFPSSVLIIQGRQRLWE